jgi:regulatory protein
MIVQDVRKENGLVQVKLEDGGRLVFHERYLADDDGGAVELPAAGGDLEPEEEKGLRFAAACLQAENAALKLTARAEQCSPLLTVKLRRRGWDGAVIAAVLRRMEDCGLVDDGRYAERWLASRLARKADSPRKLRGLLMAKGLDARTAHNGLKKALSGGGEIALLERYLRGRSLEKAGGRGALRAEGFSAEALDVFQD